MNRKSRVIGVWATGSLLLTSSAHATIRTPTSIKMNVYGVWVASADCSNPVKVFENDSATVQDLLQNPTLGDGDIPDGSYGCVILKISDIIETSWSGGSCQADIFTHANYYGTGSNANGQLADVITDSVNDPSIVPSATGAVNEQTVYLYLSVQGVSGGACFNRPTTTITPANGSPVSAGADLLANPFVVSGNSAGTFKVKNITGVDDSDCNIQASGAIWDFLNE